MTRRLGLLVAALGLAASLTPSGGSATAAAPVAPAPTVHLSAAEPVISGAYKPATGANYTFSTMIAGKPIRWNPCAPIHWRFRAAGAPTSGLTIVKQSVARVAQATGTQWIFDGTTSAVPTSRWLPTSTTSIRPVLIGWADASSSDLLRNQPRGVLGVTRTAWFGVQRDGQTVAAIKAAVIALDRTDRLPLNGAVSWRSVLLHEITHAMGLDHAGSSRQMMYPVLSTKLTDLQYGDLEGLRRVGRSAGCINL